MSKGTRNRCFNPDSCASNPDSHRRLLEPRRGRGDGQRGAHDHATRKLLLVSSVVQPAKVQVPDTDAAKAFEGDRGRKWSFAKPLL